MKKSLSSIAIFIAIGLILLIILSSNIFYTLQPGERGVIFRKFTTGLDKEHIFTEGFHMIAPWNDLHIYDVKEQIQDEGLDVLDKSGLSIHVDVTVRFHPNFTKIGELHEKFGKDYRNLLVIPEVRSEVRKVMGRYTAEEIYSTKRKQVEEDIIKETTVVLQGNNIETKALLIRSIKLPEQIQTAIENKLKQEQESLAYQFKLTKEQSEAERKRIAAEGEAVANSIINSSLTAGLLKMRGIEATIELSKSPNSKVVIIGGADGGLPLILNDTK